MACPICDQKPANCDCTPEERRQYAEIEDLEYEIERLRAENEDYRREVREQRMEIAGLREERAALLQADRPNIDRYIGDMPEIATDPSDAGQ